MKWEGYWWGTRIIAENETDQELLDKLKASLPEEAEQSYEGGKLEIPNNEKNILQFNR